MFRKAGILLTAMACVTLGIVTSVGLSAASAASPPLGARRQHGRHVHQQLQPVRLELVLQGDERLLARCTNR